MGKRLISGDFKLGVLGGGQLGKMMLAETQKWDIYTKVLDPSPEAPCKVGSNEFVQGDFKDEKTVLDFGRGLDLITVEIEHVNTNALKQLQAEGVVVHPDPAKLEIIQNKGDQKDFYLHHNIPTAPFIRFEDLEGLKQAISRSQVSIPFVWKSCAGGYDGFGVKLLRSEEELSKLPDGPCIAEDMVDFAMEIGVIVARRESGEIVSYPPVEMEFHPEANQVEYVICPARIEKEIAERAEKLAKEVIRSYELCGLLAVEMFLLSDGRLLVNEVAPRTHNSGHLTIEGNITSQFEQHLRAILDLPLGNTDIVRPAVMVNLVGDENHSGPVVYKGIEDLLDEEAVYPHIYGKKEMRPFRKMGHVTITSVSLEQARRKAEEVKKSIQVISA
jgi:5-(carboxyamino)imidazole ribonucleotide synthase